MTGPDFTTALTTLGLDTHQAAQWLGVSVKSVRRYRVSGAPKMAERLLRIALRLEQAKNGTLVIPPEKPRLWRYTPSLALDWRE